MAVKAYEPAPVAPVATEIRNGLLTGEAITNNPVGIPAKTTCPECEANLTRLEGCLKCTECGEYSCCG